MLNFLKIPVDIASNTSYTITRKINNEIGGICDMDRKTVTNVILGKEVDCVPAGFWFHFPAEQHSGDAAVQAHLDLAKAIDLDMLKIMTESLMPYGDIRCAADWKKLKPFTRQSPFIVEQIDLMKRVCDKLGDDKALLATVHGVWASMFHIFNGPDCYEERRDALAATLREDRDAFRHGLYVVTDGLSLLIDEMKTTGIHGFYYAALGGEANMLSREEFDEFIKPCEIRLLREAKDENHFVMLHMCKDHLDLTRYADYPCDAVNWGIYSDNISLEEGRKLFAGKTILGGLDDRDGVLVHGTKEQIERRVAELMDEMKGYPFILGADCTLPTDIPYDNIRAAIEATRKHAR